jgi:hypothetical protein
MDAPFTTRRRFTFAKTTRTLTTLKPKIKNLPCTEQAIAPTRNHDSCVAVSQLAVFQQTRALFIIVTPFGMQQIYHSMLGHSNKDLLLLELKNRMITLLLLLSSRQPH